ncbi:hypothetical protein DH09_20435 [Bacillaceae bacterium JMAK1]|nr:hypothetical protein DH09_20435 [Bacillaceae bacterium JMAK1]
MEHSLSEIAFDGRVYRWQKSFVFIVLYTIVFIIGYFTDLVAILYGTTLIASVVVSIILLLAILLYRHNKPRGEVIKDGVGLAVSVIIFIFF